MKFENAIQIVMMMIGIAALFFDPTIGNVWLASSTIVGVLTYMEYK